MEDRQVDQLRFHGRGSELMGISIVNTVLTIFTLGIYSFWAKIRTARFYYDNTTYLGHPFEFLATGNEKASGFIKAILLFVVLVAVINLTRPGLVSILGEDLTDLVLTVLTIIIFVGLSPIIAVGKRRYLLARSCWRNIRFRFTGGIWELSKINMIGVLLSILTLGLYYPFYAVQRKRYYINNSYFGSEPFRYTGEGSELLTISLKGLFLSIITLGIYGSWWSAAVFNYHWSHTTFQDKPIAASLSGKELLIVRILSVLLIVCTLGIGIPFAMVMYKRLTLESLGYEGEPDLENIQGTMDGKASALADGVSDAADVLDVVGDFFN